MQGSVLYGIPSALDSIFALIPILREDVTSDPGRKDNGFFARQGQDLKDVNQRGLDHVMFLYRYDMRLLRRKGLND